MSVRVRFAPSPTGLPHVGNIRTALFNWLFARHHGGSFILRIEDTDRARYDPKALDAIIEGLLWLGLEWDEGPNVGGEYGPYFQSQRLELYHECVKKLIDEGKAYYCNCPPERLEAVREERMKKGLPPMYDRNCRELGIKSDPKDPSTVIRFKMPLAGKTVVNDYLHGQISFDNATFDDIVLIKSDGFPTYHFANIVDDHFMKITHVMRAEEWIPSAGKHLLLYQAFGWEPPTFVHLPMILGPDRSKLSKRHGATFIGEFQNQGILPETMFNFLALLGWSPKEEREIYSRDDLIDRFDLDGLNTAPAVFDFQKLEWMNGEYINMMPSSELAKRLRPFIKNWGFCKMQEYCADEYVEKVARIMKERLRKLTDLKELGAFFFLDPENYDPRGVQKSFKRETTGVLLQIANEYETIEDWSETVIEEKTRTFCERHNISTKEVFHPIRLAVSGLILGPSLFSLLEIVGKKRVILRLQKASKWIEENIK